MTRGDLEQQLSIFLSASIKEGIKPFKEFHSYIKMNKSNG